jgi:hypothetical protein
MGSPIKSIAVLVVAILCVSPAFAVPIIWKFEGVTNGFGLPGGNGCYAAEPDSCEVDYEAILHTEFSGILRFDLGAEDLNADEDRGYYVSSGPPYGLSMKIGDYSYHSDSVSFGIVNNQPWEQYNIASDGGVGLFERLAFWNCYDLESNIVADDSLMANPPPVVGGTGGCFDPSFIRTVDSYDIRLDLQKIWRVPEPPIAFLLAAGLLSLIRSRRPSN